MTASPDSLWLVADIGGTNTRVALSDGRGVLPDTIERFKNAGFRTFPDLLATYLDARASAPISAACVAAAGPVHDNVAVMTNLDWVISPDDITGATGAGTVAVLNDLQAQGYALDVVADDCLTCLKAGEPAAPGATKLMVGIGTGFNVANVLTMEGHPVAAPAEAGHITLPLRTELDLALARHLEERHGFASVEEAISGRGLAEVARFHAARDGGESAATDWTPSGVIERARAGDPVARASIEHVIHLLGTLIGDFALVHLPYGGIYLVGGVARALAPWISGPRFAAAATDKGRFSQTVAAMGVWLVEDDFAALNGQVEYLAHRRVLQKNLSG